MKLALALFMLCAFAMSEAQLNLGVGRPFMGFPSSQFFQNIVLQSEAQKLLTTPEFPEDLQQRVADTMSTAELGFNDCNTMAATLPWMQIRCVTLQLSKSKTELKAIDDEAKARAAAETASAPA